MRLGQCQEWLEEMWHSIDEGWRYKMVSKQNGGAGLREVWTRVRLVKGKDEIIN